MMIMPITNMNGKNTSKKKRSIFLLAHQAGLIAGDHRGGTRTGDAMPH